MRTYGGGGRFRNYEDALSIIQYDLLFASSLQEPNYSRAPKPNKTRQRKVQSAGGLPYTFTLKDSSGAQDCLSRPQNFQGP